MEKLVRRGANKVVHPGGRIRDIKQVEDQIGKSVVLVDLSETDKGQKVEQRRRVTEEIKWADDEIERVSVMIERREDRGERALKLRTYREALRQYKSDIYMPNVYRPVLS